jgi:hypothetical protein
VTTTLDMPPHARELSTTSMRLFHDAVPGILAYGGVMIADGISGLGKTLTVTRWLADLPLPHATLNLGKTPRGNAVLDAVAAALDVRFPTDAKTKKRQDLVAEALAGRQYVLAVDEAHLLGVNGIHELRMLHDRPDARWTRLLVGTGLLHLSRATKYQHMLSRTGAIVNFIPLGREELLEFLPRYHRLYLHADHNLLDQVDDVMSQHQRGPGNLRAWSLFTRTVCDLRGITGTTAMNRIRPLDQSTAGVALARLFGTT